MLPRVFTHLNVDLDAVCSLWVVRRLIFKSEIQPIFLSADDDGSDIREGEFAVDIKAGGKGTKGEKDGYGKRHSCFALLMGLHASPEEQEALRHLVTFVDAQDTYGSAVNHLVPKIDKQTAKILAFTGINAVFRAMQRTTGNDDEILTKKMFIIIDGLFENGLSRIRAEYEADSMSIYADGRVAFANNARYVATGYALRDRGAIIVIYRDGYSMGLVLNSVYQDRIRMNDPIIMQVIEEAGELEEWFSEEDYLIARGTRKAPARSPSKVNVSQLIEAATELVENIN